MKKDSVLFTFLRAEMFSVYNFFRIGLFAFFSLIFFPGCERSTDNDDWNDNLPPAVPGNLFLFKASDGEVIVEWSKNSERDFSHYNIYRAINQSTTFLFLKKTAYNYFYDDSLYYDSTYFYTITSVDKYNMESAASQSISAKPINRYKPNAPRYIDITAQNLIGETSVYLSWEANFETDVKRYMVYRGDAEAFTIDSTKLIGISNNIFYNDTSNLQIGKKYFYKITAMDNGGLESSPGAEVSDLILPLGESISPRGEVTIVDRLFFIIAPLNHECTIKIIVQENEYYGELWSSEFNHTGGNDTIRFAASSLYLQRNRNYFWRVVTSSKPSFTANSISKAVQFRIKQ